MLEQGEGEGRAAEERGAGGWGQGNAGERFQLGGLGMGKNHYVCKRCGRSWETWLKEPKACRWCGSKQWGEERVNAAGQGRPRKVEVEGIKFRNREESGRWWKMYEVALGLKPRLLTVPREITLVDTGQRRYPKPGEFYMYVGNFAVDMPVASRIWRFRAEECRVGYPEDYAIYRMEIAEGAAGEGAGVGES